MGQTYAVQPYFVCVSLVPYVLVWLFTMVLVNWKAVHYLSYIAAVFFALEPSYIHPDEHFQSFEVLTRQFYGYSTNIPWEFQNPASRSFGVLYLVYGPLLYINKWLQFTPLALLYLARLQLVVTYFITTQLTTRILCPTNQEKTKAMFFIYTSYITWVYQSHTFSNSVETQLLLVVLSLIHLLNESKKDKTQRPYYLIHILLGAITSIGIFNRITFVAFLVFPSYLLLKRFITFKLPFLLSVISFIATSYFLILWDTSISGSKDLVIAPLNNLIYNSNTDNLSLHGLHPRYTHILVNLPQIIGPAIIPFVFRNHYKTTIPYLSILSGLFFLSLIPHQELRFLVPLVPLFCITMDFTNFESPDTVEWIIRSWMVFNLVLGVLMGSLHQRGVIEALEYLRSTGDHTPQIWWKTYSPPTWLLASNDLSITALRKDATDYVIDLMGADETKLIDTVISFNSTILLITPRSSVPIIETINTTLSFERVWNYKYHLDLDHFDFEDLRTFHTGIDIYKVSLLF